MQSTMILTILSVLALLPSSIEGVCYSPMIHGLAPDVILPSVFSSEIYCPSPHVFDHFVCMCVDPSVVRMPSARRAGLDLSLQLASPRQLAPPPSLRLAGLPDMHIPGRWGGAGPYGFKDSTVATVTGSESRRVVPPLNPYGSYNMPANSQALKAAAAKAKLLEASLPSKQQELLDKVRWRQQLQRETAVAAAAVAAAEMAAASSALPGPSPAIAISTGGSALDGFMRDTLRRILYGY